MHEGLPDVGFDAPIHYHWLTEDQRRTRAMLTTDLCGIEQKGTKDLFVRGCLALPIKSSTEEFVWGVWVSLSERNFERYTELDGDAPEGEGPWFGWLSGRASRSSPPTIRWPCTSARGSRWTICSGSSARACIAAGRPTRRAEAQTPAGINSSPWTGSAASIHTGESSCCVTGGSGTRPR